MDVRAMASPRLHRPPSCLRMSIPAHPAHVSRPHWRCHPRFFRGTVRTAPPRSFRHTTHTFRDPPWDRHRRPQWQ
eukprot:5949435-Pyramimonas_sp.AAC.1